jgi:hypothetical protein
MQIGGSMIDFGNRLLSATIAPSDRANEIFALRLRPAQPVPARGRRKRPQDRS